MTNSTFHSGRYEKIIETHKKDNKIWICQNCGKMIKEWIVTNKIACPNCGHNYPYSITYFDNTYPDIIQGKNDHL